MGRQEAIERIEQNKAAAEFYAQLTGNSKSVDDELKDIEAFNMAVSALESELPKGEWVKATGVAPPEFTGRYVCSNCGAYALMDMPYGSRQELSHFCSNCGAKMVGER